MKAPLARSETLGVDISMKDWVVIEGENTEKTNFILDYHDPLHAEYQDGGELLPRTFDGFSQKQASLLCSTRKPDEAYYAQYRFRLEKPVQGRLWVFEQGRMWASPFQWRIDDGAWQLQSSDVSFSDMKGKSQMFGGPAFAWTSLGSLNLQTGEHRLEVQVTDPKDNGQYLLSQDCFVIIPDRLGTRQPEYFPQKNCIYLWNQEPPEQNEKDDFRPWLKTFLLNTEKTVGAVVVMPGGAYQFRSFAEEDPVAQAFNQMGLHAFVLHYRVLPHSDRARLLDAQQAMQIIRTRAKEWKINPDRIAVCGFSAGGHLAAWLSASDDSALSPKARPNAVILGYAWRLNEVIPKLSDRFPPAFIWHTGDDTVVTSEKSLLLAKSLHARKRPFELHVYQSGPHGLGVKNDRPASAWLHSCFLWLKEMGWDFSEIKSSVNSN